MAKCQRCHTKGVAMWDVCPTCRWENDHSLASAPGKYHRVGYELTRAQRRMWSDANGSYVGEWRFLRLSYLRVVSKR